MNEAALCDLLSYLLRANRTFALSSRTLLWRTEQAKIHVCPSPWSPSFLYFFHKQTHCNPAPLLRHLPFCVRDNTSQFTNTITLCHGKAYFDTSFVVPRHQLSIHHTHLLHLEYPHPPPPIPALPSLHLTQQTHYREELSPHNSDRKPTKLHWELHLHVRAPRYDTPCCWAGRERMRWLEGGTRVWRWLRKTMERESLCEFWYRLWWDALGDAFDVSRGVCPSVDGWHSCCVLTTHSTHDLQLIWMYFPHNSF